jgi:hypothetical protein
MGITDTEADLDMDIDISLPTTSLNHWFEYRTTMNKTILLAHFFTRHSIPFSTDLLSFPLSNFPENFRY